MEEFIPDFILQADNVYRTRNYIVKQRLEHIENTTEDNVIISYFYHVPILELTTFRFKFRQRRIACVNRQKSGNFPVISYKKDTRDGVLYAPFACVLIADEAKL